MQSLEAFRKSKESKTINYEVIGQMSEDFGDYDTAIYCYRISGNNEKAGKLLRKQGDEDAAKAEFIEQATIYLAGADANINTAGGQELLKKAARMFVEAGEPDLQRQKHGRKPASYSSLNLLEVYFNFFFFYFCL